MKVKEIMTKDIVHLSPEANIKEALDLLYKMQISGLPVIDDKNKVVGMFNEKEILAAILPSYVEKVGRFTYQENPKAFKQKADHLRTMRVKDVMIKDVVAVDEDTTICEVAHIMLIQKHRRLPVLNKAREIAGVISQSDIVKALFAT